jgi:hypothetical protein
MALSVCVLMELEVRGDFRVEVLLYCESVHIEHYTCTDINCIV